MVNSLKVSLIFQNEVNERSGDVSCRKPVIEAGRSGWFSEIFDPVSLCCRLRWRVGRQENGWSGELVSVAREAREERCGG